MCDQLMQALRKMRQEQRGISTSSIPQQLNCANSTDAFIFLLTNKNWENITLDDWMLSNFIQEEIQCRFLELALNNTQNREAFMDMHLERTVAKLWGRSPDLKQFVLTRISKKQDINSLATLCYYIGVEYDELNVEIINKLFSICQREGIFLSDTRGLWIFFVRINLSTDICSMLDSDIIENVSEVELSIINYRLCETDCLEELAKINELKRVLRNLKY
jgi:hypothetical protein